MRMPGELCHRPPPLAPSDKCRGPHLKGRGPPFPGCSRTPGPSGADSWASRATQLRPASGTGEVGSPAGLSEEQARNPKLSAPEPSPD